MQEKNLNDNKPDTIAFLIVHGIGHQNPLETIDQFAQCLIDELVAALSCTVTLTHGLAKKKRSDGQEFWYDNYLRITCVNQLQETVRVIDIYEYYWAHYTEDQASLTDISSWVSSVTAGAKKFYHDNKAIGEKYNDKSAFFENNEFRYWKYKLFIYFIGAFLPALSYFVHQFLKMCAYIPVVGIPFRSAVTAFSESKLKYIANVIGDIAIYNTTDQKSKFYRVRQEILTGAVKAIRYLIEPDHYRVKYNQVVIAGHSLGSQISYDAINRLIHLANTNELSGFENENRSKLNHVIQGFITFGSPLDKIAFFLREHVSKHEYIRAQLMQNFHAFKQREWSPNGDKEWKYKIAPVFQRLLEELPWLNFYDKRDYVSGSLDYYQHLENIDLKFSSNAFSFTHSRYWNSSVMYRQIIERFIIKLGS